MKLGSNSGSRNVPISEIITSPPFVRGFSEASNGSPFDPDAFPTCSDQGRYERGRQLARIYSGKIKIGGRVVPAAAEALSAAYKSKAIV